MRIVIRVESWLLVFLWCILVVGLLWYILVKNCRLISVLVYPVRVVIVVEFCWLFLGYHG